MSKTLMKRAEDKVALWQLLEDSGGELNETTETWLKEIETNLATKVDSYRFALDELEHEAKRLRSEAQQLANAAKSLERIHDAVKDRIKTAMKLMGVEELEGHTYRFKLVKGAPKLLLEEEKIPDNFKVVETTFLLDKDKIRNALEKDIAVPGAKLEELKHLRTYIVKGNT